MSFAAALHQRFSPFSLAGRLIRSPMRLVPKGAVVPVLGGINKGYRWVAGASTAGCWIGSYEADHQAAIARLVAPGMVVYDVGANVGFYTLAAARIVGPSGHVFAFEPEARNVGLLRRHVALNQLRNVTIVQAAVGEREGLVGFAGEREQGRVTDQGDFLVPALSLDGFIASGRPAPDFVKMDVEGAEAMALAGAARLLQRAGTNWMIATHSAALNVRCRALLDASGHALAGHDMGGVTGDSPDFIAVPRR